MYTPLDRMLTLLETKSDEDVLLISPPEEKVVKIVIDHKGCNICNNFEKNFIRAEDDMFISCYTCGNCGRDFWI